VSPEFLAKLAKTCSSARRLARFLSVGVEYLPELADTKSAKQYVAAQPGVQTTHPVTALVI
jgi:hypothetical protein